MVKVEKLPSMMTDCEIYQDWVYSTTDNHCKGDLEWAVLGLTGEVGEVASLLVKAKRKHERVPALALLDECGDCLWYLAAVLSCRDLTLDDCIEHNIDKINRRIEEKKNAASKQDKDRP